MGINLENYVFLCIRGKKSCVLSVSWFGVYLSKYSWKTSIFTHAPCLWFIFSSTEHTHYSMFSFAFLRLYLSPFPVLQENFPCYLKITDCDFHEDQLGSGITFSWSAGFVNWTVTEYVIIRPCFGESSIQNSDIHTEFHLYWWFSHSYLEFFIGKQE